MSTMSSAPWGGSEELWATTALEALQAGHEVTASVFGWSNESPKLAELERRGVKVLRRHRDSAVPSHRATSNYLDLFKTNPDVIVVSQGWIFDVPFSRSQLLELLYVSPTPFVLVCQLNERLPLLADDCLREHARNIFSRAFKVLFVSNQNRIDAERQMARNLPNAALVLNPVNLSDRSSVPWPESRTARFANVARFEVKHKAQDILIETLSTEEWQQRDWHLTLYGTGPDERYLRSLIEFFHLQERITLAGYQSDVRSIWAKEHVLLMFSRAEGNPLALVEAMLCGRPAVVTDIGGNAEWVTEPETGFVAEAPAIALTRAAMERAWSVRQSWQKMGMRAHQIATKRIGNSNVRTLLEVVVEAAERRHSNFEAPTADELQRQQRYKGLMQPTIRARAKQVVQSGVLSLKNTVARWRDSREEAIDRSLLRLGEPK
jgi:glycosyltransferase involved in cell wall biosynthesis